MPCFVRGGAAGDECGYIFIACDPAGVDDKSPPGTVTVKKARCLCVLFKSRRRYFETTARASEYTVTESSSRVAARNSADRISMRSEKIVKRLFPAVWQVSQVSTTPLAVVDG